MMRFRSACVLTGAASVAFLTTGNSTIQLASEPDYRGRVTALWSMALVGSTPIGSPIIGALSDLAGPRYALGLGAAGCVAAAVVGYWPAAHARNLPEGWWLLAGLWWLVARWRGLGRGWRQRAGSRARPLLGGMCCGW
jgi:MFS family permease